MKANTYLTLALHDLPQLGITNREKVFCDFANDKPYFKSLPPGEDDSAIVFRLGTEETDFHEVARHGDYKIVVPEGARIKHAIALIERDDHDSKVAAIAQVKEIYLAQKRKLKLFTCDKAFKDGMRLFTEFTQGRDATIAQQAFTTFINLCRMYKT